jgi:predicted house-cleaning noncanonical NTP pyrophosphatase (MazG superfamily)
VFKFTNDDAVLEELVKHLNMIVHIAAAYNFNEAVDSIIVSTDDVIRKFDENSF